MNKLKKILALLMVAAFALMSVAFANDTENEENRVQPRSSEYFRSYSGSIVAKGNGRFNIVFNVTARSVMTKLGATSISVYKNGSYVYTIDYTDSGRSEMMKYNTIVMSDTESYQGTSGATYYAKIYLYAKNSNGSDTVTYTTSSVRV